MKKIKICGITEQKEVEYLNKAGVDYAGFIQFFPKSKRNLPVAKAKELIARLDSKIQSVAVVVSPSGEQLREIEEAGFSMVQIHGEISESLLAAVKLPVLKAFNITDLSEFSRFERNQNVVGYVFDAQVPGSGKTFDWSVLKKIPATSKMTLLAGGLNPSNVAEALLSTNVDGADTSSGVERESGAGKDPEKIRAFVQAVKGVEV